MIEDNGCPCAVSLGQTPDDATRPKPSDTSAEKQQVRHVANNRDLWTLRLWTFRTYLAGFR